MQKNYKQIRKELLDYKAPRFEDLPDFDLYMDQVLIYINKALDALNFEEEEKTITSSMVNNYVKNSIVKPPVRKHYKSYHLAYLLIVCIMKRCYSLKEIQQLIQIYSNLEESSTFQYDFNKFMSVFEAILKEVVQTGHSSQTFFEEPSQEQTLMVDVITTIVYKIYSEYNLEKYIQSGSLCEPAEEKEE